MSSQVAGEHEEPSLLAFSRAAFSEAKNRQQRYWSLEVATSLLAFGGAFVPHALLASAVALAALATKLCAKVVSTAARSLFRCAERARRYDFEHRTLGWSVPGRVHTDLLLAFPASVESAAAAIADQDADYFAKKDPPSTERFLWNLLESMFWTENLMAAMVKRRTVQFSLALAAAAATLCGLVVVEPSGLFTASQTKLVAIVGLKLFGAFASLFVTVDLYGELKAFARGAGTCRDLVAALEPVLASHDRDEGLRFMVEYYCLLADLPVVPDDVHTANRDRLNRLWGQFSERISHMPHT